MAVLGSVLRSDLERAVGVGRRVAERAAVSALTRLGVLESSPPAYLSELERQLRRGLRARARQLGDSVAGDVAFGVPLLMAEVAYEQWHRVLFARFLEANGLLMHPEYGASVTLEECGELAAGLGEADAWSVAARFASEILPGIFRTDDPAVRVRLAPEDLLALERVVGGLPEETFLAEDSLGWVYQFWQSKQKKLVRDSGRKIGGADISPVTQLFTEDYMVSFLLENSLGAWWAGKYPESPLLTGYEFLRFDEDGVPAAGMFEGWPDRVAEVTVMDPCCGSGHFLVAAFGMLWRMRAEEEGLSPAAAQDAVLRENLFGLELDARCTQLAMFALALEAWKQGGYRALPVPNVACSGIPAKAPLAEWTKLAKGDYQLESALTRLHELFKDADTLGSLIDPVRSAEQAGLESVDWDAISPLLIAALDRETQNAGGPAAKVFGHAAAGIARAAQLLSDKYTLIATNPPYLGAGKVTITMSDFLRDRLGDGRHDLFMGIFARAFSLGTTVCLVLPAEWMYLGPYREFRREVTLQRRIRFIAKLGSGAFRTPLRVNATLCILDSEPPIGSVCWLPVEASAKILDKIRGLSTAQFSSFPQLAVSNNADVRINPPANDAFPLLQEYANARTGLSAGDSNRFDREFWEVTSIGGKWERLQGSVSSTVDYGGRSRIVLWESESGSMWRLAESVKHLNHAAQNWRRGKPFWDNKGIAVSLMGKLASTLYSGDRYDINCCAIVPDDESDLPALWAFAASGELALEVRKIDQSLKLAPKTLLKVPCDIVRWRAVAAERYPRGLPQPFTQDPTQWLFKGVPAGSAEPLQVSVARLVGFRWPDQEIDASDCRVDNDGIVCLPAVSGEQGAAERVRAVLAASFGSEWSNARIDELLIAAGGKTGDLEGWLRDAFFKHHTKFFQSRPFVWHVWDGRADGFSALLNYQRLTRQTLEKLTYTTLGWWIDRQRADARAEVPGAAARLTAAEALQAKLALILEGEPPFDIYVRWKSLAEQPIGWDPDLDDGVRMNIRPFVEAKVLRSNFTINWRKDRGTNPDGSERHNDLHFTRAQKEAAR